MASHENAEPEVLHVQGFLTPLQDWPNERRLDVVPQLSTQRTALAEIDRFKGRDRAARVVRQQRQEFCENMTPSFETTYRIGAPKGVIICICKPGEHE
ncbi:hypothetical protein ACFQ7F_44530 [Streptomyces sp. NPDC056486]|uniref:hypothetical protein n=1 Tax=Streptomyces sp. NPDC056486 TaxID=3345835 RepID=UPI0036B1E8EA